MAEIQIIGITIEADSVVVKGADFDAMLAAGRESKRLSQELSLAEEGLANYAQDLKRVQTLLGMVAVHMEHPGLGGLSEDQKLAISEWYEHFRMERVAEHPTGEPSKVRNRP